jgi:outer membrane protein insertion porin family
MISTNVLFPRTRAAAGAALLCLCVFAPAAFAQSESFEGTEIRGIEIDAPVDADVMRIRDTIRTREGDLYRGSAIQADIAALYALGQYQSVSVETKRLGDGVALTYHVRTRPVVVKVTFEGHLAFSEEDLRALLQTKPGAPASPYLLKMDREALQGYYIDHGYAFAEVLQQTRELPEGAEIVYVIEAGPPLRIESVRFAGNSAIPDEALRKAMVSVQPSGLFRKGRYDPPLLRSDLLAIREMFRRKGYLDATVGHEILYEEGRQRAYVLIRVHEGPLYRIGRLLLRDVTVFSPAEILNAMKSTEGGPYSQEELEKDFETIRDLYGAKGYVKARVRMDRVFSEERPAVTLTLNIEEGEQYRVRRVLIRGNHRTQDHVVRREVTLLPGELADSSQLRETRRRLANTGLFYSREKGVLAEPISVRFVDTGEPGEEDVLVDVTEGGVGEFQIGGGISSSLGLVGLLRLTYRNFDARDWPRSWRELLRGDAFTGGGQKLTLSLTPGTIYRDYRLSWLNPAVWDSPYSVGFDAYMHDLSLPEYYDDSRVGIAFTVGRRFTPDFQVSLIPRYERVDISNVDGDAPADARRVKGTHDRRALALSALYDKRDNVFMPTTGYSVSGDVEMTGTALGGDVDFMRETFGARRWWTVWDQRGWGKHVVNLGGEFSLSQPTGSSDVPIFDRLFMGGVGSFRGFEYRRVGPVGTKSKLQVGGDYRLLAGGEYEAPLFKDLFRGVLFIDTGSLAESFSDIGDEFRATVGFGVRARLPMLGLQQAPLSLYFATPVLEKRHDRSELFSFTIGTGFEF